MLENILLGFSTSLTPENLLWCLIGVVLGTVIGMLPGLGATTGVAVLLPLTLSMEPVTALIMLAGIYYGCQYGGTIAAVLIATPGDANAVATVIDGYALARKGQAGKALAIAAIGSFVAAVISLVLLMLIAAPIATFALRFGPAEMLAIMIMGLLTIISFSGDNLAKGLMMAGLGLFLSAVGMSTGFAQARFTFGNIQLLGGIDFVVVMIGVFAIGEVVSQIGTGGVEPITTRMRDMRIKRDDVKQSMPSILRGSGVALRSAHCRGRDRLSPPWSRTASRSRSVLSVGTLVKAPFKAWPRPNQLTMRPPMPTSFRPSHLAFLVGRPPLFCWVRLSCMAYSRAPCSSRTSLRWSGAY